MSQLIEQFDNLMSHLNSEDNDMAWDFRELLVDVVGDSEFLNCLVAAGVDNWDGYSEARGMMERSDDE
ncbi:hypothetical protein [Kosakonia phage Kc166A]|uniref:Uncharacterized protein n=1 Tax=Kosakonia phage Kc166A TaxID=2801381 RepID=A0AAE7RFP0_9CAUD|nr:hypothetical protein [Kosakonia phage Kc166A]